MEAFIGTILPWPINYAPEGWAFCQGQILQVAQYQALFALIGNIYGGDGRTTFALPDLRGRVVVGAGQGAGLSNYALGQKGGLEAVPLAADQIPPHAHNIPASTNSGSTNTPANNMVLAKAENEDGDAINIYKNNSANTAISPTSTLGGGYPHTNIQPYLALNFIICLNGIWPSRP